MAEDDEQQQQPDQGENSPAQDDATSEKNEDGSDDKGADDSGSENDDKSSDDTDSTDEDSKDSKDSDDKKDEKESTDRDGAKDGDKSEEKSEDKDEDDEGGQAEDGKRGLFVKDSEGEGRAVVLIHGWPLSGESWNVQREALKDAGYRVVTYDRRGFGKSDPGEGYGYDDLADDLANVLEDLDLHDVTLVGFSMGGGEVARYVSRHGEDRLHSVVFAAAIAPYLLKSEDNPDGPLEEDAAKAMREGLEKDRDDFFDDFSKQFFSAGDELKVTEDQRKEAIELAKQSNEEAALACMDSFATTDFRKDLEKVSVPTLVIHGDSDGIVPFEGSGKRTHEAIEGSEVVTIEGGPHGIITSHSEEFNDALLEFLEK